MHVELKGMSLTALACEGDSPFDGRALPDGELAGK